MEKSDYSKSPWLNKHWFLAVQEDEYCMVKFIMLEFSIKLCTVHWQCFYITSIGQPNYYINWQWWTTSMDSCCCCKAVLIANWHFFLNKLCSWPSRWFISLFSYFPGLSSPQHLIPLFSSSWNAHPWCTRPNVEAGERNFTLNFTQTQCFQGHGT